MLQNQAHHLLSSESKVTGRNGGHLTPGLYTRFHELSVLHGVDEAAKSIAIEHYTVSSIIMIIKDQGWESAVDLVSGGHVQLVFTNGELEEIELDLKVAEKSGVPGLEDIKFLDAEVAKEVR